VALNHPHHRRALAVIAAAAVLDTLLGLAFAAADHLSVWNGLYFALTTATTVGYGDITAHGWAAHVLAALMMTTVIPLFASAFSLLTSGLTDVAGAEERIKDHVNGALRHHLKGVAGHTEAGKAEVTDV
jgi:hypothetical protein